MSPAQAETARTVIKLVAPKVQMNVFTASPFLFAENKFDAQLLIKRFRVDGFSDSAAQCNRQSANAEVALGWGHAETYGAGRALPNTGRHPLLVRSQDRPVGLTCGKPSLSLFAIGAQTTPGGNEWRPDHGAKASTATERRSVSRLASQQRSGGGDARVREHENKRRSGAALGVGAGPTSVSSTT